VPTICHVFSALFFLSAAWVFVLFVLRLPAHWNPRYVEGLRADPLPRLSKENANRGQFLMYFYLWIWRSRVRSAVAVVVLLYCGVRFWSGQLLIPT